jgi:ATP-dependent RNA helicase DDX55/SPB4
LSIVFLQPGREEDYVSFLEVRKTPVTLYDDAAFSVSDADASKATQISRAAVMTDRALHDKGQRAFVSWVRSYSKHQASSIFRVSDLDWVALGHAWGLLKLPRMPELRSSKGDTSLGVTMDWENYAYKDKQREAHRQETLKEDAENNGSRVQKKRPASESVPWSQNAERREEREKRREKKKARRDRDRWDKMTEEEKQKVRETETMVEKLRIQAQHQRQSAKDSEEAVGVENDEEFQGFD